MKSSQVTNSVPRCGAYEAAFTDPPLGFGKYLARPAYDRAFSA